MNRAFLSALTLVLAATIAQAAPPSPYAGQESRDIKALAAEDVNNYLAGKGMGLAKAAELNGYPGPSHVLSLANELGLSPEQKQRTEALFKAMEAKAKDLGRSLVDEERKLDRLFAAKAITPETLGLSLQRIGELQARVRQAHLEAHLAQVEILSPEQVAAYMKLRGYGSTDTGHQHAEHSHHH